MSRAVLALGSNIGDRQAFLYDAYRHLIETPGVRMVSASPIFENPPWGPIAQDSFLNAVLIVDDMNRTAAGWLELAVALERNSGRIRDVKWGPRTLDVDVIAVFQNGEPVSYSTEDLQLPHPFAHERAFVLVPWLAADTSAVLPGHGAVSALVAALPEEERSAVRLIADDWP